MNLRTLAAIGCLGATLAACGGGGGGSTETATPVAAGVPASALASIDAFVAYLRQLGADETSEPLGLPDAAAPTSDTTEPAG